MKGRPNADAAARSRGVCTACPMLCDDIVLLPLAVATKGSTAKGSGPANVSQSSRVENACEHGQAAFDTAQQSALVDAPDAWEHGRPMASEPAIARAAEALAGAKRVLVTGLRAATLEAIAMACDIAESLGAAVDAGLAESSRAAGPTIARVGEVTAAWEELRDRADLVVFWFCDPTATHPRFLERFVAPAQARTFAIGPFAVLPPNASHRHLPMARAWPWRPPAWCMPTFSGMPRFLIHCRRRVPRCTSYMMRSPLQHAWRLLRPMLPIRSGWKLGAWSI